MNNIEKDWVYSLHITGTITITQPTTTMTIIALNYSEVTGNRNLTCIFMGSCTWHWVWFRDQRKQNLCLDSLPRGVAQNYVSGTLYTGADSFHIWPPGSLTLPGLQTEHSPCWQQRGILPRWTVAVCASHLCRAVLKSMGSRLLRSTFPLWKCRPGLRAEKSAFLISWSIILIHSSVGGNVNKDIQSRRVLSLLGFSGCLLFTAQNMAPPHPTPFPGHVLQLFLSNAPEDSIAWHLVSKISSNEPWHWEVCYEGKANQYKN